MVVTFKEFMKNLLRDLGGEILDRADAYIWVRVNDGIQIYKVCDEKMADEADVLSFHQSTELMKGTKIILCPKGIKDSAKIIADKLSIEVIDRDELIKYIGEYTLNKLMGGENIFDTEVEEEVVEEEEDEEEEETEDIDTIPIILEDTSDSPDKVIKMSYTRSDILSKAKELLKAPRAELHLIPYYLFDYSLRIMFEDDFREQSVSGIIAINGVTGEYEIWKSGYETEPSPETAKMRIEPKIDVDYSKELAREGLIEEYTQERDFTVDDENVTIIEKRRIKPLENSIKISYLGLYYLPVWEVTGINGRILYNAASGEKIKESYKDPFTF